MIRGGNAWRIEQWGVPCQSQIATMAIYAGGPKFQANILVRPAFTLLGGVFMKFGYIVRRIGAYNCRKITGGTTHSSHSWGISVDVNDDTNPYRKDKLVTDMSDAMIQAIYNIKTFDGVQVFVGAAIGTAGRTPEIPIMMPCI